MGMDRMLDTTPEKMDKYDLERMERKLDSLYDAYLSQADVYKEELEEVRLEIQRREEQEDEINSDIETLTSKIESAKEDLEDADESETIMLIQKIEGYENDIETLREELQKLED